MGTYLSTPVREKSHEQGSWVPPPPMDGGGGDSGAMMATAWGVVDMQGWRKSMEDAHVARVVEMKHETTPPQQQYAQCFGVFDGHGGPEVARFCALYWVAVWQQESWRDGHPPRDCGEALRRTFHRLDRLIEDPARRDELVRLRAIAPQPGEQRSWAEGCCCANHDGCKDDDDDDDKPPATSPAPVHSVTPVNSKDPTESSECNASADNNDCWKEAETPTSQGIETFFSAEVTPEAQPKQQCASDDDEEVAIVPKRSEDSTDDTMDDEVDSIDAAGVQEAVELDEDLSSDDDEEDNDKEIDPLPSPSPLSHPPAEAIAENGSAQEQDETDHMPSKIGEEKEKIVTGMFQRLLNLSGASGQVVLQVGPHGTISSKNPTTPSFNPNDTAQSPPTLVRNGQMFCNLPDHPIHAGATAIVAVLQGHTLTVANAGDSRAVLCRAGGETKALSFDHKPMQTRELNRIRAAGGFVSSFGRVNGNLNLSRSIGDLKYKQVHRLPPEEQMITAEPDIVQITLEDTDEFIILGCDGIWDCLTNEKAVEFVRERISEKTLTDIGVEMLDTIISDDPRASQGIGGDNMTIMIIDLQPQTRSYRHALSAAANNE